MKRILFISCWIGIVSYCILAIIAGPTGIIAQKRAIASLNEMNKNLEELKKLKEDFSTELSALETNPETMALEGRALGYVSNDEIVINTSTDEKGSYNRNIGSWLLFSSSYVLNDKNTKIISFSISLACLLLCFVFKLLSFNKEKNKRV